MDFFTYWEEARPQIDKHLENKVFMFKYCEEEMRKALAGGKRVRGTLTLLVCEALGGKREDALDRASAIEFVQAASLIHDDFIDGDEVRRGRPALWVELDPRRAILLADVLFSSAQLQMEEKSREDGRILAEAIKNTAYGAAVEALDEYQRVIPLKTGALFAAASRFGAVAAKQSKEIEEKAFNYGLFLGEAFQIADDVMDAKKVQSGDVNLWNALRLLPTLLKASLFHDTLGEEQEKFKQDIDVKIQKAVAELDGFPDNEFTKMLNGVPRQMVDLLFEKG